MKQLLLVFLGGGTGSIARYLLSKFWNTSSTGIPYGTFTANILGRVILHFLQYMLLQAFLWVFLPYLEECGL